VVNQRAISMKELTDECIERHGTDVLEGTINRHLIEQTLRKSKAEVTQKDIDAEVARAAISMGKTKPSGEADVQAWLDVITRQQGISTDLYLRDSVWPSVALKKIVGDNILITDDDLRKGFEANFGPRIRCRAIVLASLRKAQEVWEKARQNPTVDNFGKLAEDYSVEANSRALRGEVPPIQRYGGQPQLEKEAFDLQPGEISGIIQTGATFVILFCEGRTNPEKVEFKEVRADIYNDLREKKLRIAMARKFEEIKESAEVDNFLAGSIHSPKAAGRSALEDPSVRPASAQGRNGKGKAAARNPDMSVEELIRDSPTP
jgi:parvulin-like peptidyl-prolyl isomerase